MPSPRPSSRGRGSLLPLPLEEGRGEGILTEGWGEGAPLEEGGGEASPIRLPRTFFARPTLEVAPDLLGLWLVHDLPTGRREGRIVEVEAYCGVEDLACHAAKGRTARTSVMFGPAGRAYVYLIYGMHHCFNVVTDADDMAGAVLVRALEPGAGVTAGTHGPGRLGRALSIDRTHTGLDLTAESTGPLWLERRPGWPLPSGEEIASGPRINVDYAGVWAARPWRFYLPASPYISVRPPRRASGAGLPRGAG